MASLIFTGCGSDDDPLISKTITTPNGLTIELTWTINGQDIGYEYVDVDFVLDDLEQGDNEYESSSGSSYGFEDAFMENVFLDGTYYLAPFVYNFEVADEEFTTSDDIQLTFKIYPGEDDTEALLFKQKLTYENYNQFEAIAYAKYVIVKTGETYKIKELSKIKEVYSGWYEGN